jgi:hypothetical protein
VKPGTSSDLSKSRDAHIQDGDNEFLDVSGINGAGLGHQLRANRLTKPAQDQDKIILQGGNRLEHKQTLNSVEYREHEKHNGTNAEEIRKNHHQFAPLTFTHTGGILEPNQTRDTAITKSPRTNSNGSMHLMTKPQVRCFARILATTTANTAVAHMKMNLQHYYKTLNGPKADLVELNLWTMIPMSTTTREMLDPEADTNKWIRMRMMTFIRKRKDMA